MGQSIVVLEKPSSNPGVVRFETNRAITGMGHERYVAGTEVWGHRPPDELARRLLARGGVAGVQINGNVVTVDLEKGYDADGLKEIVENLYRFYPDQPAAPAAAVEAGEATADEAPADEVAEEPVADEAAADEVVEEPVAEESAVEELAVEEPVAENAAVEDAVAEDAAVVDAAADEPEASA